MLFNKRALLFREYKKKNPNPKEKDYKKLILTHYSYLKRPILMINNRLVAGISEKSIKRGLNELKNYSKSINHSYNSLGHLLNVPLLMAKPYP